MPANPPHGSNASTKDSMGLLTLGALGVVYGDIGTSPLYTIKTAVEWSGHDRGPQAALTDDFHALTAHYCRGEVAAARPGR